MLQGWSLSGILVVQNGLPWFPNSAKSKDIVGTGEFNANPNIGGALQLWNYTGPGSAFTSGPPQNINGTQVRGIPKFAGAAATATCGAAATAPYAGNANESQLALAALSDLGCYAQNGGILTPPAYGTEGDAGRNIFLTPNYYNVDMSVAKLWTFRERYSAQFRVEFFNLFNRTDLTVPSNTDPTRILWLFLRHPRRSQPRTRGRRSAAHSIRFEVSVLAGNENIAFGQLPKSRAGSTGRCNTTWYKSFL